MQITGPHSPTMTTTMTMTMFKENKANLRLPNRKSIAPQLKHLTKMHLQMAPSMV
jgi:hypothetical protein